MLVELKKKTVKITGSVYYYVTVDGDMQSSTWTTDQAKAQESFQDVLVKCIAYPEDRIEVIKSETI
jgi:hypothetical protein